MKEAISKILELRFPEFEGGWKEKKFSHYYSFKTTNSLSRGHLNYSFGKVKNIHYGDIHTKFKPLFDIRKEKVPFINEDVDISRIAEENYLKEGDLVIADASEDYNDIGKTIEIISLNNEKVLAGLHTLIARKKTNELASGFTSFILRTYKVRLEIMKIAQGTKILGISKNRLDRIRLYAPSLPEQTKIANFLTTVDEKIEQITNKKELLEKYKKGMMQQLFPQKDETNPRLRFKQDDGSEFGDWKLQKLGKFLEERNIKNESDVPLYSLTIENGMIPKTKRYERSFLVNDKKEAYKLMEYNDFAFNPMNLRFGALARYKSSFDIKVSKYYNIFYCNENGHSSYFEYFLTSYPMIQFYNKMATGSLEEKKRVHYLDFINFKLKIPSLEEQTKIAEFLTTIDEKISNVENQLIQMQEWKKGLLQKMFV